MGYVIIIISILIFILCLLIDWSQMAFLYSLSGLDPNKSRFKKWLINPKIKKLGLFSFIILSLAGALSFFLILLILGTQPHNPETDIIMKITSTGIVIGFIGALIIIIALRYIWRKRK